MASIVERWMRLILNQDGLADETWLATMDSLIADAERQAYSYGAVNPDLVRSIMRIRADWLNSHSNDGAHDAQRALTSLTCEWLAAVRSEAVLDLAKHAELCIPARMLDEARDAILLAEQLAKIDFGEFARNSKVSAKVHRAAIDEAKAALEKACLTGDS